MRKIVHHEEHEDIIKLLDFRALHVLRGRISLWFRSIRVRNYAAKYKPTGQFFVEYLLIRIENKREREQDPHRFSIDMATLLMKQH